MKQLYKQNKMSKFKNTRRCFTEQEISDQWFIMENALLECAIKENIRTDDLMIYTPPFRLGMYYIVNRCKDVLKERPKVWFAKKFK
jgi:acyl-CoA synthetase (AMP-forming)/AMP-acid ligase II